MDPEHKGNYVFNNIQDNVIQFWELHCKYNYTITTYHKHKVNIFSLFRVENNICVVLLVRNSIGLSGGGPGNVPSNRGRRVHPPAA